MRLWHQSLIPHLPRQQLLGQHRECCALRGRGWGRPHATVNYVFKHEPQYLIAYHYLIMAEMIRRGYNPDRTWICPNYRGSALGYDAQWNMPTSMVDMIAKQKNMIYPEHNKKYLQECLENLKQKGIDLYEKL